MYGLTNTMVQTNDENKTISCVQNVTWKYYREKFRFIFSLMDGTTINLDILGIKTILGLMAGTYGTIAIHIYEVADINFFDIFANYTGCTFSCNYTVQYL